MDIFKLSRNYWDYAFANPELLKPTHCAIYFFSIEHCNRLGWKDKFGLPTSMVMEATGIKSYSVYKKHFDDLAKFGFFSVVAFSKNQYSSNVIALKENVKAHNKALDKAMIKHTSKQTRSTNQSIVESTVSIDIPINNTTNIPLNKGTSIPSLTEFLEYVSLIKEFKDKFESLKYSIQSKYESWVDNGWKDGNDKPIKNWKTKLKNTLPYLKPLNTTANGATGTKQPIDWEQRDRDFVSRVMGSGQIDVTSEGDNDEPFTSFEDA
jgi:hypothetical protein